MALGPSAYASQQYNHLPSDIPASSDRHYTAVFGETTSPDRPETRLPPAAQSSRTPSRPFASPTAPQHTESPLPRQNDRSSPIQNLGGNARVVVQVIALGWSGVWFTYVPALGFWTWERATKELTTNGWNRGCVQHVRHVLHLVLHQPAPARSSRRYLLPECTWPTAPSLPGLLR